MEGKIQPTRPLLITWGADTGDFKSPALALGRGQEPGLDLPLIRTDAAHMPKPIVVTILFFY